MELQLWVDAFVVDERPDGNILDPAVILALAVVAANRYAAFGALAVQLAIPVTLPIPIPAPYSMEQYALGVMGVQLIDYHENDVSPATYFETNPPAYPAIDGYTDVTVSEWAIIRPLFILYVERETALQYEASRAMGIDPVGRSSDAVAGDIERYESETMPKLAFSRLAIITI